MKYYVIRKGKKIWIFTSRAEVQPLVSWFLDAKFKSFKTLKEAEEALHTWRESFYDTAHKSLRKQRLKDKNIQIPFNPDFIAVDAACSWNPWKLEYRWVDIQSWKEIFHHTFELWTNNIWEFLAIYEGIVIASEAKQPKIKGIYSDSKIAIERIEAKKCRSLLQKHRPNLDIYKEINKAEKRLHDNTFDLPILKRKTSQRWEIPADFGRK